MKQICLQMTDLKLPQARMLQGSHGNTIRNSITVQSFSRGVGVRPWRNAGIATGSGLHRYQFSVIFQEKQHGFRTFPTGLVPRSSNLEDLPPSKGPFAFNLLDILGLLVRIPALILGILGKERKFVEQIQDEIEDAAEIVENIAESVENVADAVAKVAETIAKEAHETQELMDKVEESTKSMRSDIGTAIDVLEGKYSENSLLKGEDAKKASEAASRAAQEAQAAKEAVSEAANKADRVREAAEALEKATTTGDGQGSDVTKHGDGDNDNSGTPPAASGDSSKTGDVSTSSASSQRYRASSGGFITTGKFMFLVAMLFALLFSTWCQAQVTSSSEEALVKFLVHSFSSSTN